MHTHFNLRVITISILFCLLTSSYVYGQINSFDGNFSIWVDSLNKISNFQNIPSQSFQKYSSFEFENSDYAYWVNFNLKNPTNDSKTYWLEVGVFDSLTLVQKNDKSFNIQHKGLLVHYDKKQKEDFQALQEDKYGFEIILPPNSNDHFYLRVKNTVRFETTFSNIKLQSKQEKILSLGKQLIYFTIFSAAFFGIILFFILFSLFQYFQNKDSSYCFYAIYLSLNIIYFWWKFEKSNSFINIIFTDFISYYYYFESPLVILIYISYFYFVVHFLNAKKELYTFYRILNIATPILIVYGILNILVALFWELSLSWEIGYWVRFILVSFSFFAIYQVFKSKHQLGFYILSGTSVILLGGVVTSIFSKTYTNHYVGPWDIPLLPIQVGMFVEIMFFSAGLAFKSRLTVQEKTAMLLDLDQREKEFNFYKKQKEALTNLYTNLSHEFRTPLTVILGALRQIKGNQKERNLIRRNGNQLLNLTNQILDLNKLENHKMQVNWKQGDIMSFIRYCAEPFEVLIKKKNQTLEIFFVPNRLVMDFDSEKIQIIINNLLSNAIKFTPNNEKIRIDGYEYKEGNESSFRLDISDSGVGIPAQYQQTIFDHYTQLPNTEGGTGLGLALVKEFTLLLGGRINLNSEEGKGSTFNLSFPIHNKAQLAPDWGDFKKEILEENTSLNHHEPIELISGRPSILLVEDNEDVQQYLKQILESHYNIFIAENGKIGLVKVKEVRPDIIISDVMMPELNGYEFCQKVKTNPTSHHIPIILVTAKASHQDKIKGFENNADAYLSKPFDEEELLLRIQQLLNKNKVLESRSENVFVKNGLIQKTENGATLFMENFHKVLNENLQNENFKIKSLCVEMGLNHVSINNKIKQYTNQTTAQYIRNYRLNLAKELLQTTELSVAEISYQIGIPEPANFNNMFKKAFGKSPKQWKNS